MVTPEVYEITEDFCGGCGESIGWDVWPTVLCATCNVIEWARTLRDAVPAPVEPDHELTPDAAADTTSAKARPQPPQGVTE